MVILKDFWVSWLDQLDHSIDGHKRTADLVTESSSQGFPHHDPGALKIPYRIDKLLTIYLILKLHQHPTHLDVW